MVMAPWLARAGRSRLDRAGRARVVGQFDKETSQTRDYCVATNATQRAARLDPSLGKKRLFRMTNQTDPLPALGKASQRRPSDCRFRRILCAQAQFEPERRDIVEKTPFILALKS